MFKYAINTNEYLRLIFRTNDGKIFSKSKFLVSQKDL